MSQSKVLKTSFAFLLPTDWIRNDYIVFAVNLKTSQKFMKRPHEKYTCDIVNSKM